MNLTKCMALAVSSALLAPAAAVAQSSLVEPGHTAAWYDPARSGEGWVLEILNDDRATVYWYTYDDDGGQRWLTGVGEIRTDADGRYIDVPELVVTRGASFGESFDPTDVVREVAGNATFRFQDCQSGVVDWSAFGESASVNVKRLSRTMGAGCEPINGIPGEPVRPYAGQSGDWYDKEHSGEGFTVQWLTRDEALVFWFTYDDEGNQFWMSGLGHAQDGSIVVPELTATRGGRFGSAFDPAAVERFSWGAMDMSLACNDGGMNYESTLQEFGAGSQNLKRLSRLASPACPYVKPKLTDIYDIEWVDLPLNDGDDISAHSIADDGTVLGVQRTDDGRFLVVLPPGATEWVTLEGPTVDSNNQAVLISNDGTRAYAGEAESTDSDVLEPVEWLLDNGWAPLTGFSEGQNWMLGGSRDRTVLAGRMDDPDDGSRSLAWTWDAAQGLVTYRGLGEFNGGTVATTASDDGWVIIGYERYAVLSVAPPFHTGSEARRWVDGEPKRMFDKDGNELARPYTTSADGGIVFGSAVNGPRLENPEDYEPWVWTADGKYSLLDIDDEYRGESLRYTPTETSADGSMTVGQVRNVCHVCSPAPPPQGFVWTQATGVMPTWAIREALGLETGGIENDYQATSVSSDGRLILLDRYWNTPNRAAVLKLTPKQE